MSFSNKIAIGILFFGVIFAGYIVSGESSTPTPSSVVSESKNNVSVVGGKQIIEIAVRGGYQPENSTAKAGIPTVVRFTTKGTFDCSSAVRIPEKNISKNLPQTGVTDIDIGIHEKGTLACSCGMGMYPFSITFE